MSPEPVGAICAIIMIIVALILSWKSGSSVIILSMIMRSFCHDCHSLLALDQPAIARLFPTCTLNMQSQNPSS